MYTLSLWLDDIELYATPAIFSITASHSLAIKLFLGCWIGRKGFPHTEQKTLLRGLICPSGQILSNLSFLLIEVDA